MMERAVQKQARRGIVFLLACVLLADVGLGAQTRKKSTATKAQSGNRKPGPPNALSKSKEQIISMAKEHKANLESLIQLIEAEIKRKSEEVEKTRQLYNEGILAKLKVEEREAELAAAKMKLNKPKKEVEETDDLITETVAEEQLARMPRPKIGSYTTTNALIRYMGPAPWALENIARVSSFFVTSFKRELPISAFGQSAVHDRMNFDHRNSVDVAIHPDSAEGQALLSYLRSQGIPFLAFRSAVPGAATGAHIHIGNPSHRIR
jgi:hypothetical protein